MLRVVEASRSRQNGSVALVNDWSTMAVRGGLSIVLGLAVLLWPAPGLGELVVLFGIYALLDGIAAATWAVRVSRRSLGDWPLLLGEAVFSVGLGVVALGFRCSRPSSFRWSLSGDS
jgi:uncharacterized membrane protein HdeD (DUF308 family)